MSEPTVAVLGASQDRRKFGNKAVRAYRDCGLTVLPVNPREATIEGLVAYPNLDSISEPLDYVSVYLPPAVGLKLLPEIVAKGCDELWLNPGSDSDEIVAAARAAGLDPIVACSIVDVGVSPHELVD